MGEVALVTGGSRGIGRAIALVLARRGSAVAVNYLRRADEAKETVAQIEQAGGEAICIQADVSEGAEVDRLFAEAEDSLGPVGILVNNAGIRHDGLALRLSDDSWKSVIDTNLYGTFACSRRALRPMLRAGWGRIINVGSVAGLRGSPGQANYAAAKAGVIALTKTMAREVATKRITVNAVAPGLITTELTSSLDQSQLDALQAQIPQGSAGKPEDVAEIVGWLSSKEAGFVTGSVFVADGGMTA